MASEKYDKIHKDLMDYILSGKMHSTLIGKVIHVNHSDSRNDLKEVEDFVEYITDLLERAEKFGKDNLKKA